MSLQEPQNFSLHGVRINFICPISVDTDMLADIRPGRVFHAEDKQESLKAAYKLKCVYIIVSFIVKLSSYIIYTPYILYFNSTMLIPSYQY